MTGIIIFNQSVVVVFVDHSDGSLGSLSQRWPFCADHPGIQRAYSARDAGLAPEAFSQDFVQWTCLQKVFCCHCSSCAWALVCTANFEFCVHVVVYSVVTSS